VNHDAADASDVVHAHDALLSGEIPRDRSFGIRSANLRVKLPRL